MSRASKQMVNEQFDLFLPYIADLSFRDQREMMERPFFSLAKSKRVKPIDYTSSDGKLWVHESRCRPSCATVPTAMRRLPAAWTLPNL